MLNYADFDIWWSMVTWFLWLWPNLRIEWSSSTMVFYPLSNAAYCFPLRDPGAKLGGGALKSPHPVMEKVEAQQGGV